MVENEDFQNYYGEIRSQRFAFEKAIEIIKRRGLFGIMEKDLDVLFKGLREMSEPERNEVISNLLVRYGTYRLRMCGYNETEITKINEKIKDNINLVLSENIAISMEEIFRSSIEAWENSEQEIKYILTTKGEKLEEKRKVIDMCRKLVAGGGLAIMDLSNIKVTKHYASAISLISSAILLSDLVFYRR
jgi:hypothetical protein